ncbi:MAG: hypothetical protein QGG42_14070 [Phycisphaerae bacterium]|jgi:hypothetical protein|nr:hypothetical protein [Phycisphaerae bacterium]
MIDRSGILKGALWSVACVLAACGPVFSAPAGQIQADWLREEQVTRNVKVDSVQAIEGAVKRGRLMIIDFRQAGEIAAAGGAAARLDAIEAKCAALREKAVIAGTWKKLYFEARWAVRKLAFANPKLNFKELLFVRRNWPKWNHQCSHRVGEAQQPGANICVLSPLAPDGRVRNVLSGKYANGGIGRPDLSYDGRRIVFPYASRRPKATSYGYGKPDIRGGACLPYDIYEAGLDGKNPKRLTNDPKNEDTEPCYLPDGRIAFMSSRAGRLVQCGDWALACGMYSMKPDGSDVRQITEPKEGEFYPSMLDDGRIMYTRWDYVMKGYNVIQQLWAVNPDGRRAQLVYGDHYAFSRGPIAFQEARQIPGTSKVICVGAAHHNSGVGPIMIVDTAGNRGGPDSMRRITPQVAYPEIRFASEVLDRYKDSQHTARGRTDAGWYSSPYPLSENQFIASYSFDKNNTSTHGYGLYLCDVHGNRDLIYRGKGYSCYSPIPLRARAKPRIIPDMVRGVDPKTPGVLTISDIYQGLDGIKRGEVKHLRVLETYSKTVHTTPQRVDMGVGCGWDARGVLGVVPVEADGSAHFEVPPFKQIFFEALDDNYLEIRRMRNFMNVMPGEKTGCVGCHEPYGTLPAKAGPGGPVAMKRPPSKLAAPPWGDGAIGFKRVVQPVLDLRCISCHDGSVNTDKNSQLKKSFDLRGTQMVIAPAPYDRDQGPQHAVSDSFLKLLSYVSYIKVGGYPGRRLPLGVNATGSRVSKLMKLLADGGHYKVKLKTDEWRALAAWIDCNAPFYGGWDEIVIGKKAPRVRRVRPAADGGLGAAARRKAIEGKLRIGVKLDAFLNCGAEQTNDKKDAVRITQVRGRSWSFAKGSIEGVSPTQSLISFDDKEVVFEISGLTGGRRYSVGLTWWDFDTAARKQSVWVSNVDGSSGICAIKPAALPSYKVRKHPPAELSFAIDQLRAKAGKCKLAIRKEAEHNSVICEIWITSKKTGTTP